MNQGGKNVEILSRLRLVDVNQLAFQERVEPARLNRTCQSILEEGVLRHPIIVTPLMEGRYLILDGAHRTQSLRQLGCMKIPVQVVEASEISFNAWEHLLPLGLWMDTLQQLPTLQWVRKLRKEPPIAEVVYPNYTQFWIYPHENYVNHWIRLQAWHQIVEIYTQNQSVIRLPHGRYVFPESNHVLFRYPTLTLDEVKEIVLAGKEVPAGVTRCIVQERVLNLQIPLTLLTSPISKDEWNRFSEKKANKLRLYSESIYLCEA
nr:ParB N-terminal domain-containing protein [Brevibacillus sp. HB1.1]